MYWMAKYATHLRALHSIRFWVFLSKIVQSVQYDLWLFQLFLAFFNILHQQLSGYASQISFIVQWNLDLRRPDFRKNLDLRKIVHTTNFLKNIQVNRLV